MNECLGFSALGEREPGRPGATFDHLPKAFPESAKPNPKENGLVQPGQSGQMRSPPAGKILLPIDLAQCPLEVFPFVNNLARRRRATVTLLHVLTPEILELRLLDTALATAKEYLDRLARKFVHPELALQSHVRLGQPAHEIITEAQEIGAKVIVLTSHDAAPRGKRHSSSAIVENVLGAAPCHVSHLLVRTHFNCELQWDLVDEVAAALDYVGLLKPLRTK